MGFEGVAVLLVGTSFVFFHLYTLFKERGQEEARTMGWTQIINENLANLFFGLGLIMVDLMLYIAWLYSASVSYVFADILRSTSLIVLFITIAVAIVMILKVLFVFLQMFFEWATEKVGLMK